MHLKLIMFFIIIGSISHHAMALITSDVIPTQILKVYDQNILAINRGLEDGMFKGSHIKLTSDDGFIARGISLKSSMTVSYVKIYRVIRPELVSKDTLYSLKDMHQSEIPEDLEYLKNAELPFNLKEIKPSELGKQLKLQQKRIAKFDLPKSIKKAEKKRPSETESFIQKNISASQFKKDFANINLDFFMSPYQTQTLNDQKNLSYGVGIRNFGSKYEFSLQHSIFESSMVDPYTQNSFTTKSENTSIVFDVNKITDNLTYFMFGSREVAKNGDLFNPKLRLSGGFFGLKYHFVDDDELSQGANGFYKVDISYIPLYEIYTWEFYEFEYNPNTFSFDQIKKTGKDRYIRHSTRFRAYARVSQSSELRLLAWWKPYQNFKSGEMDWENNLTDVTLTFSTNITNGLFFNTSVNYTYDILQQRNFEVDPQNIINSVSLNYTLPIRF